jgi:hypothetical protein
MKISRIYPLLLLVLLVSCNDSDRKVSSEPENEMDAARNFIRAALDGDYKKAKTLLVNDSLNLQDIEASERLYIERMSKEDKEKYRGASIHIHESRKVDDSTSIVHYSNTYRNQKDSLKIIKVDGKWLVDFKYIFKHKPDSLR